MPPWGIAWPPDLPADATTGEVSEAAASLAGDLERGGVHVLALRTRTVGVEEFNRDVERLGTKASVLFQVAMDLVAPWLDAPGDAMIQVDRHGGRAYYSLLLTERFPGRHHWIVHEGGGTSTYVFPDEAGDKTLSFEVKGDSRRLAIALASMAAKYVRELHMRALNEYFTGADPDLAPTAGYYGDSGRWLRESESLRRRLDVPDARLVRRR